MAFGDPYIAAPQHKVILPHQQQKLNGGRSKRGEKEGGTQLEVGHAVVRCEVLAWGGSVWFRIM